MKISNVLRKMDKRPINYRLVRTTNPRVYAQALECASKPQKFRLFHYMEEDMHIEDHMREMFLMKNGESK